MVRPGTKQAVPPLPFPPLPFPPLPLGLRSLENGFSTGVTIADEQCAAWTRTNAKDLTTSWVTAGRPIDVIFANNDEMAIGAIQALKAAGVSMDDVIVAASMRPRMPLPRWPR